MNLIVGATGMLGGEICRLLADRSEPTRALVRSTSNPDRVASLRERGIDVVHGDLKDPSSLHAACDGVRAVVSTASSTLTRQEGDSIDSVDRQGQLSLVDAAERAGVTQFVLVSFPEIDATFPLQSAKRAVEERLRRSRMIHTILQPTFFTEVWLSPALGFDPLHGTARIYGAGQNKISWISFVDVAKFAVDVLDNPRASNSTIELGGPDALSPLDVVRLVEQASGATMRVEHVPEDVLRAQCSTDTDPLQQSFAALMLGYARGEVVDMTDTLRAFPVGQLKAVHEHFHAVSHTGRT